MHNATKRVAAFSAAILGFALIGTACHKTEEKGTEASSTSASASTTSGAESTAETSGSETAAPSTTKIAGADGTEYEVSGVILTKYESLTEEQRSDLEGPKAAQKDTADGGVYQEFEGGVIIHKKDATEAFVVWGKIRDKWNELGGSQGELGYPTSDETTEADGTKKSTFEHGTVTWDETTDEVTVTKS